MPPLNTIDSCLNRHRYGLGTCQWVVQVPYGLRTGDSQYLILNPATSINR